MALSSVLNGKHHQNAYKERAKILSWSSGCKGSEDVEFLTPSL
jgi:hypothetical protein